MEGISTLNIVSTFFFRQLINFFNLSIQNQSFSQFIFPFAKSKYVLRLKLKLFGYFT